MKARVKATGEIVEARRICQSSQGPIWEAKGSDYYEYELDFNIDGKFAENCLNVIKQDIVYEPDYWERLKHQYAGMAMQGLMTNPIGFENIRVRGTNIQIETALLASEFAHALVEKLKEEKKK